MATKGKRAKKPTRTPRSAQANARARMQMRTAKAQAAFLRAFSDRGIVLRACLAAKIGRRTVYGWLAADEAFKALYDEAKEDALDLLEDEAVRRARVGWLEPVYQGGEKVGEIRKYSDTLLITALKAGRPGKFRELFQHEHAGKDGGPITFTLQLDGGHGGT